MNRPPHAQLTHLGIYVRDMDAMVAFYSTFLGLVVTDHGELRGGKITFLSRDPSEHHQLVLVSGRPEGEGATLVNQISFRVATLEDLQTLYRSAVGMKLRDLRPSNHGNAWSIYFLDPEGNRLEIYAASPWYVGQPCQHPVDMNASAEDIRAATYAMVVADPTFQTYADWHASMQQRLAG